MKLGEGGVKSEELLEVLRWNQQRAIYCAYWKEQSNKNKQKMLSLDFSVHTAVYWSFLLHNFTALKLISNTSSSSCTVVMNANQKAPKRPERSSCLVQTWRFRRWSVDGFWLLSHILFCPEGRSRHAAACRDVGTSSFIAHSLCLHPCLRRAGSPAAFGRIPALNEAKFCRTESVGSKRFWS